MCYEIIGGLHLSRVRTAKRLERNKLQQLGMKYLAKVDVPETALLWLQKSLQTSMLKSSTLDQL